MSRANLFARNLEAHQANADARRARGLHTGKQAAGWNRKERPDHARTPWELLIGQVRAH